MVEKKSLISEMIECHKFFVEHSPSYAKGKNSIKYYIKYPRAYFRFMIFSYKSIQNWKS